jgi:large subunit ribosomal protein L29
MPVVRMKEIRDMSSDTRAQKIDELKTELVRLKTMIGAGGTVDNPARVKVIRKVVAKMLTVEHEETHGIRTTKAKKEKPKEEKPKEEKPKKVEGKKAQAKKAEAKKAAKEKPEPEKRKKK